MLFMDTPSETTTEPARRSGIAPARRQWDPAALARALDEVTRVAHRRSAVSESAAARLREVVEALALDDGESLEPGAAYFWHAPTGELALLAVVRIGSLGDRGGYVQAVVRALVDDRLYDVLDFTYPKGAHVALTGQADTVVLSYEDLEFDRWIPIGWDRDTRCPLALDAPPPPVL